MKKISKHISYGEATKSNTAIKRGIENDPNEQELANMKLVAVNCFEPLRVAKGIAIGISSFFRAYLLNKIIGGSATSQHCAGGMSGIEEAGIDIDADIYGGITNKEIADWLKDNVEFDQLILEYPDKNGEPRWVHISYRKGANRNMIMRADRVNGKTKYTILN